MKIVFVTTQNPYSSVGGLALYSRQILDTLADKFKEAQIEVLALVEGNSVCNSTQVREIKVKKNDLRKKVVSVFMFRSFSFIRYLPDLKPYKKMINDCDLLIINHRSVLGVGGLVEWSLFGGQVVYINHNDEFNSIMSLADLERNPFKKLLAQREAKKVYVEELKLMQKCNAVSFINQSDQRVYRSALSEAITNKFQVIPIYINTPNTSAKLVGDYSKTILLIGSFDWLPKRMNAEWLSNEVFPLVLNQVPEAKLLIVGRAASELSVNQEGVSVYSDVADVKEFYNKGLIFAIPEKQEGGLKIKSVEAAFHGKAIVTSRAGASGSELKDKYECLYAELEKDEFSDKLVRLLKDEKLAVDMGVNARSKVREYFDSELIKAKWYDFWSGLE